MPARRTGGRRMPVHMINYKAPTPHCERTVCGVSLGATIAYTLEFGRVTCQSCQRLARITPHYKEDVSAAKRAVPAS